MIKWNLKTYPPSQNSPTTYTFGADSLHIPFPFLHQRQHYSEFCALKNQLDYVYMYIPKQYMT